MGLIGPNSSPEGVKHEENPVVGLENSQHEEQQQRLYKTRPALQNSNINHSSVHEQKYLHLMLRYYQRLRFTRMYEFGL